MERIILLFVTILAINCSDKKIQNNVIAINYDSLLNSLPEIMKDTIGFENYSQSDLWDWSNSEKLVKLNRNFYSRYLSALSDFDLWDQYQNIFLGGIIRFEEDLVFLLVIQEVKSGDISNMYLLPVTRKGIVKEVFKIASLEKSPDDLLVLKSVLNKAGNSIESIKEFYFTDNSDLLMDSIKYYYQTEGYSFKLLSKDSLRVLK